MSQRLRQHPDDLAALVAQTATAHGLPTPYVEKDFWVTEVLRAAPNARHAVLKKVDADVTAHLGLTKRCRSMVADYEVNVLAPERTLLEKIAVFSLAARKTRERCRRGL